MKHTKNERWHWIAGEGDITYATAEHAKLRAATPNDEIARRNKSIAYQLSVLGRRALLRRPMELFTDPAFIMKYGDDVWPDGTTVDVKAITSLEKGLAVNIHDALKDLYILAFVENHDVWLVGWATGEMIDRFAKEKAADNGDPRRKFVLLPNELLHGMDLILGIRNLAHATRDLTLKVENL